MATNSRSRTKLADTPDSGMSEETHDAAPQDPVVIIPKTYTLTLDNGGTVSYSAGTQTMPMEHAMHWWSKASGVTIFTH